MRRSRVQAHLRRWMPSKHLRKWGCTRVGSCMMRARTKCSHALCILARSGLHEQRVCNMCCLAMRVMQVIWRFTRHHSHLCLAQDLQHLVIGKEEEAREEQALLFQIGSQPALDLQCGRAAIRELCQSHHTGGPYKAAKGPHSLHQQYFAWMCQHTPRLAAAPLPGVLPVSPTPVQA